MERASETILLLASEALLEIEQKSCGLDDWLDFHREDLLPNRRALSSLLFAYFRKRKVVDSRLETCWNKVPEAKLHALLRVVLASALFQDALHEASAVNIGVELVKRKFGPYAGRFANAVLRRALQEAADAVRISPERLLPEALEKRWEKAFGTEETARLGRLFQEVPANTVRVRFTTTADDDVQALDNMEVLELPWKAPWQFMECSELGRLLESDAFQKGKFYVQDPAPAFVMTLLEEFMDQLPEVPVILDLCAAPGGKLLMADELLKQYGKRAKALIALDRSARRQKLTEENSVRCGVPMKIVTGDAAKYTLEDGERPDLILADVPCSNTGVFRHRPDALWRWNLKELRKLTELQWEILAHGWELLKENGLLLYSTCSLEAEEDQMMIGKLEKRFGNVKVLSSRLLMPGDKQDGTFAALLRKEALS